MRMCSCGNTIPSSVLIDGKRRSLTNRSKCLICLPFGSSIYSIRYSSQERSSRKLEKGRKKQKDHYDRLRSIFKKDPTRELRRMKKSTALEALGGACMLCGYAKSQRNLTFHHVNEKAFPLPERAFQFSWNKLIPEMRKCVLVCHNCHGEIHDGFVSKEVVSKLHKDMECKLKDFSPNVSMALVRKKIEAAERSLPEST